MCVQYVPTPGNVVLKRAARWLYLGLCHEIDAQCLDRCVKSSLSTYLSDIQQVDLQKKAQGTSCDLVGGSADGIAYLAADRQPVSSLMLEKKQGKNRKFLVNQIKL